MGRRRTWDRDDVLRRATRVFWERGYEGAHLSLLVEATGVNRFGLYKEFGSKEGLFVATLRAYIAGLEDLAATLQREPLGLDNVRAFFLAVQDHPFHHGCFALNTIREKHVVGAEAWKTTEEFAAEGEALLRANLEAAQQRGDLAAATDTAALARFLAAIDCGLLSYGILNPGDDAGDATLAFIDRLLV